MKQVILLGLLLALPGTLLAQHGSDLKPMSRQEIVDLFDDRTVTFLIGSSVSFDGLLIEKGFQPAFGPTIQLTDVDCASVGVFKGKMAVTIRAFDPQVSDAVWKYTSHFPQCHGEPVGKNNWELLGIAERDVNILPRLLGKGVWVQYDIEKYSK